MAMLTSISRRPNKRLFFLFFFFKYLLSEWCPYICRRATPTARQPPFGRAELNLSVPAFGVRQTRRRRRWTRRPRRQSFRRL